MALDAEVPANSVYQVGQVRIPRLRNSLWVLGSLLLGFVAGEAMANPSSHKFQVRKIETGEVVNELGWGSGGALRKDLEGLSATEFAELWVQTEVTTADEDLA